MPQITKEVASTLLGEVLKGEDLKDPYQPDRQYVKFFNLTLSMYEGVLDFKETEYFRGIFDALTLIANGKGNQPFTPVCMEGRAAWGMKVRPSKNIIYTGTAEDFLEEALNNTSSSFAHIKNEIQLQYLNHVITSSVNDKIQKFFNMYESLQQTINPSQNITPPVNPIRFASYENIPTPSTKNVIIYSADLDAEHKHRVAIDFNSKEEKDQFIQNLKSTSLEKGADQQKIDDFIKQFSGIEHPSQTLYIKPSNNRGPGTYVPDAGKELSINFGSNAIREAFTSLIGITKKIAIIPEKGNIHGRDTALYFRKELLPPTPDPHRLTNIRVPLNTITQPVITSRKYPM